MVFDNEALKSNVSRYGLLPSLVICLQFVEGNAFGVSTTIKQS